MQKKSKLLITTALAGASFFSYGRKAYATPPSYTACHYTIGTNYLCNSSSSYTQNFSNKDNASVSTDSGFSVNTTSGNAITITGDGDLSFTDTNASILTTTAGLGLYVKSNTGSVTINADSIISSSGDGIKSYNSGSGINSIIFGGSISSSGDKGIFAYNSPTGGSVVLTAEASADVASYGDGISTSNFGTGSTIITAYGHIVSTGGAGIDVQSQVNSVFTSIKTGDSSYISGMNGIAVNKYGTGPLDVTANGTVVATVGNGILAYSSNTGSVSITTGAESYIKSYSNGINVTNNGSDKTTITVNGTVKGEVDNGIYVKNADTAADLIISSGAGSNIIGGSAGIYSKNLGAGWTNISVGGDVTGDVGIYNYTKNESSLITIQNGGTVIGHDIGIKSINVGSMGSSIVVNGYVKGETDSAIYSSNTSSNSGSISVTTNSNSYVKGQGSNAAIYTNNLSLTNGTRINISGDVTSTNSAAILAKSNYTVTNINVFGTSGGTVIKSNSSAAIDTPGLSNITLHGSDASNSVTITGTGGTAINMGSLRNKITVDNTVNINGDILGGGGIDIFSLNNAILNLGTASNFSGFETIKVYGDSIVNSGSAIAIDSGDTLKFHFNSGSTTSLTATSGITFSGGSITIDAPYSDSFNSGTTTTIHNVFSGGAVSGVSSGLLGSNSDYFQFTSIVNSNSIDLVVADKVHTHSICTNTGGTNYTCDNSATVTQDFFGVDNAHITTGADLNINASAGSGIVIKGDGDISFTDTHSSTITTNDTSLANTAGLRMIATGSSLTINANSNITGYSSGIYAVNNGTGSANITVDGHITALSGAGIIAEGGLHSQDLNITTGVGSIIESKNPFGNYSFLRSGITAFNLGYGDTNITVNGDVTSDQFGIFALSGFDFYDYTHFHDLNSSVNIETGSSSYIHGNYAGIITLAAGRGETNIVANGTVSGGIVAYNVFSSGGSVNITTGAGSYIKSSGDNIFGGILVLNNGGDINITTNGSVNSTNTFGIGVASFYNFYGFYNTNIDTNINITINGGTSGNFIQSGNYSAIIVEENSASKTNLTLNGGTSGITITGGNGTAIELGNGKDIMSVNGDVTINGDVIGGAGKDTIILGTDTTLTFGSDSNIYGFEKLKVTDTANTTNVVTDSALNMGSGVLSVKIDSVSDHANLVDSSGITFDGGRIAVDAATISSVSGGATIHDLFSGGDVSGISAKLVRDNSSLYRFTSIINADSIDIQVEDQPLFGACHHTSGTSYKCDSYDTGTQNFSNKNNANVYTASGFELYTYAGAGILITGDGALSFTDTNATTIYANDTASTASALRIISGSGGSTITVDANSNITSAVDGIYIYNQGTGATSITFDGTITNIGTGSEYAGIHVINKSTATDVTVTTGSDSIITSSYGYGKGISVTNNGTGFTHLYLNGDITSGNTGVEVSGDNIKLVTAANTYINADRIGVKVTPGAGINDININGEVNGAVIIDGNSNSGTVNVTTGAFSSINSGTNSEFIYGAIYAKSENDLNITVNGDVAGQGTNGIYIKNTTDHSVLTINGGTGGTSVTSDTAYAIEAEAATPLILTLNGTYSPLTISGGDGVAIKLGDVNDTLLIMGDVTINGSVNAGSGTDTLNIVTSKLTLDPYASFNGFEAVNITGALTIQKLQTITINSTNPISVGSGGSLKIAVASDEDYGKMVGSSGITFHDGGTITVDASELGSIASGTRLTNVFSGGTVTGITAGLLSDNNDTYNFTSIVNGDSIDILITSGSNLESVSSVTSDVGRALDTISNLGSGDDALATITNIINGYDTISQQKAALRTLTPDISSINFTGVLEVSDTALDSIESRIGKKFSSGPKGISTGDETQQKGVWGELFGKKASQGTKDDIEGYNANVAGYIVGADTAIGQDIKAGGAISYANTKATSTNDQTAIDSTQATLYGIYDYGKLYYEALGLAAINHFDGKRTLFDNSVAQSNYDNYLFSAKAVTGYHADFDALKATPFVSLQYSYLIQPDYTETGSNAPLHVESDDLQVLKSGLGTKLQYDVASNGYTYSPHVSAAWYYDLINDTVETTANFTSAAETTFISRGATPGRNIFKFGAGIDILSADNLTISLDYDVETRQSFTANTGAAKIRLEF